MSIESSNLQLLVHQHAAIDVQGLASDVGPGRRSEEQNRICDVGGFPQPSAKAARKVLDPTFYDYIAGGSEDELTLGDNRAAWSRWGPP